MITVELLDKKVGIRRGGGVIDFVVGVVSRQLHVVINGLIESPDELIDRVLARSRHGVVIC